MQLVCTLLHSGDLGEPMVEILEVLVEVVEKNKGKGYPLGSF